MKATRLFKCFFAAALLLSAFSLQPSALRAQGNLTPPGAPAPVMKTLDQIEARTPISAAPFTISAPGSYYLTTNVTTTVSNAIVITASGVTLDLNGFTLASTMANAANGGTAILLGSGLSDLTILNGHIRSGVTNNGSGVFSGSGFANGIVYSGTAPVNTRISGISAAGCLSYGIYLNYSYSTVVESCAVRTIGSSGIFAPTIKSCLALDCGGSAILGDQVSDSRGASTGSGDGLSGSTAQNCYGSSSSGVGVVATIAQNCYGSSGSYYGLYASTAQNCYGSSSTGTGLSATRTANNCYGSSTTGTGLYAYNASFCTGQRSGGTAIQATIATGCIASSGTNNITYKYNMP